MPLDSSTAITIAGVQCWDAGTKEEFTRVERSVVGYFEFGANPYGD
jgi:hypothetical protein